MAGASEGSLDRTEDSDRVNLSQGMASESESGRGEVRRDMPILL
jgi:hypothetical protein